MNWSLGHLRVHCAVVRCGILGMGALGLSSTAAPAIHAQRPMGAGTPAIVFDHVTVVDVEHGKLLPSQRVVIEGTRIQAVGTDSAVRVPAGALVVEAAGKYLIPGLWDMHVHADMDVGAAYSLFVVNGVTGIRDAGSPVPLDVMHRRRNEILAGARVGPPRQILSGQSITGPWPKCNRSDPRYQFSQTCVADSADAVHYVDSLKAAGADMIKPREVMTPALYAAIAAEARRVGLPFGGHASYVTELAASDFGATIIDHTWGDATCAIDIGRLPGAGDALLEIGTRVETDRGFKPGDPKLTSCWKQAVQRFRRNGTWFVPTLTKGNSPHVLGNFHLGLLLLAGTDSPTLGQFGVALHKELALYVAQGLTPLEALQTATLNPARMLHATDSLGTVARGKLADLVLLDANPLADITNTTMIRAVVANGRYYSRAALDTLMAQPANSGTASPR